MQITFLGQAGLFIETRQGTILCDPWFNPAYFASWFPFPSNENIDLELIRNPTYLYVSHLHHDHYDPEFLRDHVCKDATVLLPDYPLDHLEVALRDLGFKRFINPRNSEAVEVDGLRFMIMAEVAPTDGPIGDSGLMVDDGETRIFNQNDSRPVDIDKLNEYGPYDAHFLQFSGAIWYPMVYRFSPRMKAALGRKKRQTEMARALRYAEQVGAANVIPSAGPPCFLDDALWEFNDFHRDPANTFPDQTVFIEYMREHGRNNGHLMIPGSVGTFQGTSCQVNHPMADEDVDAIFTRKREYLQAYKLRKQSLIDSTMEELPRGQVDILPALKEWWEPLLDQADLTCVGVNGRVLLDMGREAIVVDFQQRKVYAWEGEDWSYAFYLDPGLVETCVLRHEEDWVNELFLSCRFGAARKGPYNEYVYNFFKCLSLERLEYAEGYYVEQSSDQQLWECDGYRIQRRCPHLKADLQRFAQVENGVLTCTMHGWQFELASGRCLTSADKRLYTERIEEPVTVETVEAQPEPARPG